MIILEETTRWDAPNHIYIFKSRPGARSAEALAYIPVGSDRVVKFRKPITLDLKGRTFRPVD
jgi:hypothetical protein